MNKQRIIAVRRREWSWQDRQRQLPQRHQKKNEWNPLFEEVAFIGVTFAVCYLILFL